MEETYDDIYMVEYECISNITNNINLNNYILDNIEEGNNENKIKNFNFNDLVSKIKANIGILNNLEKIQNSYFTYDDSFPLQWFINSLQQYLNKLPKEYIENDYELLYKEIKNDIINSSKFFNLDIIHNICKKLKYEIHQKKIYEDAERRMIDINLNEKVQYIIDKFKSPCEIHFSYNEKEQKISVREITNEDKGLQYLNSTILEDKSKNKKNCITIRDFVNYFPNLVKSGIYTGEKENIIKIIKKLEVTGTINKYLNVLKNKLGAIKIWNNEEEFKIVNNKIYDFIMEKLYDKIFPNVQNDNDIKINNICLKLSWIEPINIMKEKNNYILDSIFPEIVSNFKKIEEEKSPRKKMLNIKNIYKCIKEAHNFECPNNNILGTDDLIEMLTFGFIKAQLEKPESNNIYLKLFIKQNSEEEHILTQLNAINEFIMNISHKALNISKEEFDANCEKASNEIIK